MRAPRNLHKRLPGATDVEDRRWRGMAASVNKTIIGNGKPTNIRVVGGRVLNGMPPSTRHCSTSEATVTDMPPAMAEAKTGCSVITTCRPELPPPLLGAFALPLASIA
jgi:hypothetical protein